MMHGIIADFRSIDVISFRELLANLGYEAAWRESGWHECLLLRGDERWFGTGSTPDGALLHALAQAFPPSRCDPPDLTAQSRTCPAVAIVERAKCSTRATVSIAAGNPGRESVVGPAHCPAGADVYIVEMLISNDVGTQSGRVR